MALRVLHCPTVVGGNPAGLAAAERELGVDSRTLVFEQSPYGYPVDEVVWAEGDSRALRELKRLRLLPRVVRNFDVVHFNFGSTLMPGRVAGQAPPQERLYRAVLEQLDLPLLARAGIAIFVTFQGDDARQGTLALVPAADANKRRRIVGFDRHASAIYALNPDLLRVLPARARFMPYAHVDLRDWEPEAPAGSESRPLVVHAPTDRGGKGTRYVVDAVSRLRTEGLEFDFQLVEGLPHVEATRLYRRADIVIDQLLIGWYGGLAVEAMALGRPTVAYLREDDLSVLPAQMRTQLPVISAEPRTIHEVMKELLTTRRAELPEIGRRGREYVRRWHDPLRIAREVIADYEAAVVGRRHPIRLRSRSGRSSG